MVVRKLFLVVCLIFGLQSFVVNSDSPQRANAPQRIHFTQKKLSHLFKKAKAENKLVFILVESKHCAVCRRLDRDLKKGGTFSSYFNDNFLCYKIYADDMFKQFKAQKWGVSKVPTLIFMNGRHKIVHFVEGYSDMSGFTAEAKKAETAANDNTSQK